MEDENNNIDKDDEDILTYSVSDEALEAAGGRGDGGMTYITHPCWQTACNC